MEQPFFFEHEGARLFAVAHRPARSEAGVGLVFCHPYGEEKQFSYRVPVRFARLAAEAGIPALRFDCRGYGDSEGDIRDCTVETLVADVEAACMLARERLEATRIVLVGLRFGATLASVAAERGIGVAGLALWSPIVSGARYVSGLLRKKQFGDVVSGKPATSRETIVAALRRDGQIEIEGNPLTLQMYEDLEALELPDRLGRFHGPVMIGATRRASGRYGPYEKLLAAYRTAGAAAELTIAGEQEYWDDRSMFERVFPEELYAETLRWLAERAPRPVRA